MALTILLPMDGSATAKSARRFAVDVARGEGARVLAGSVADRVLRRSTFPVVFVPLVALSREDER